MEAVNGRLKTGGVMSAMACAFAVGLSGCFLTDHTERDEVSTRDLNFPASGYEKLDAKDYPRITFDALEFDMGKVVQGARVEKLFRFTNTGGSPLVLSAVNSTCGCTVGKDWPKAPIAPGAQGEITVVFDSEGRSGMQHKSITVVSNALPASTVLTLFGEVIGPDTNKQP
ncbi:MAG: DUF1573 domain-containing protein [Flavobacteriales bacterium]|nr:DUF1573 domain-containing protein [Flavobacteriales bacterium]